jgi:hypothetical protein
MLSSVGLNDRLCEDVQRYSAGKQVIDARWCSSGKDYGAIASKISKYGSNKCTTLGLLFAYLED